MGRAPVDDPKMGWVPISLRIPPVVRDKIMKEASDEERTYSAQIRHILKEHVQYREDLEREAEKERKK